MNKFLLCLAFFVGSGAFAESLTAQARVLTLSAGQLSGKTGATVCVNVSASGMRKVISMQYSVKWDSKVLELVEVKNYRLPGLAKDNFGTHQKALGLLTCLWIDDTLKGIDLPNGSPLYQLCFRIKGKTGASSTISFVQKPTPFESVNAYEQMMQIVGVSGKVTVL
ncbi:MAG: hypothetical protein RL181_64 [Bacteroidota bacterium]